MTKNIFWQSLVVIFGAVLILLFSSVYLVYQPEQAIVLQFGEPVRLVTEPGLKFKVPFIQNVVFYDARLLNLDPPAQEVVLNDKKRLDVDSFTRYRIIDPLKFYQTVRTEEQARSKLAEIVNSSLRKVLGRVTLTELLSEQRTQIMQDISSTVKKDAEAYKSATVNKAEGEAKRFASVYAAYKDGKDVTVKKMYLDAMEEVLQKANKVIIDPSQKGNLLPVLPLQGNK